MDDPPTPVSMTSGPSWTDNSDTLSWDTLSWDGDSERACTTGFIEIDWCFLRESKPFQDVEELGLVLEHFLHPKKRLDYSTIDQAVAWAERYLLDQSAAHAEFDVFAICIVLHLQGSATYNIRLGDSPQIHSTLDPHMYIGLLSCLDALQPRTYQYYSYGQSGMDNRIFGQDCNCVMVLLLRVIAQNRGNAQNRGEKAVHELLQHPISRYSDFWETEWKKRWGMKMNIQTRWPLVPSCRSILHFGEPSNPTKSRTEHNFQLIELYPDIFSVRQAALCRVLEVACEPKATYWTLALGEYMVNEDCVEWEDPTGALPTVGLLVLRWLGVTGTYKLANFAKYFVDSEFQWEARRWLSMAIMRCGCGQSKGERA